MACEYDFETTYFHRIWFANVAPVAALSVCAGFFAILKARPSIGEPSQRLVGQAMTDERMERDWLVINIIKGSNMVMYFVLPTVKE